MEQPTRASLILRLQDAGDMAAWNEFATIYSPTIYRVAIARGFQPADAENLVQEVLASVARSVTQWLNRAERGGFRRWLLTIARNELIDMLTRRATRPLGQDGETAEQFLAAVPAPSELSGAIELEYQRAVFQWAADQVRHVVEEVNWKAFWMTSVEGLSVEQAAAELEIQPGQIYCSRSRIMAKIKKLVQQHEAKS
ncbi:MAG: RNA polymerase sigma factor [Planctomycetaceae bacterium]|nr:RNA polymerase sigma factor [Planctomycetaceae bacterium]